MTTPLVILAIAVAVYLFADAIWARGHAEGWKDAIGRIRRMTARELDELLRGDH